MDAAFDDMALQHCPQPRLEPRVVGPARQQLLPQRGHVVALGPGKLLESGQRAPLSVSVGDEVIYGKYSGSDIEVDGHDVKILRESDILAKVLS